MRVVADGSGPRQAAHGRGGAIAAKRTTGLVNPNVGQSPRVHCTPHMVARFRARAARRAEEARLAAETMGEELARQSENMGTRQEEEALDWERKVEAEHERVESDTEAQTDAKPPIEDDDEKNLGDD